MSVTEPYDDGWNDALFNLNSKLDELFERPYPPSVDEKNQRRDWRKNQLRELMKGMKR